MLKLKSISQLFLGVILLFSVHGFAQKINQKDANGNRTGLWKKNYDNGNLRYTGNFVNGREVGVFKFYPNKKNANNPIMIKEFLSNGMAKVKYFTKKGKLEAQGNMKGKQRVGKWTYYFGTGKIFSTENYANGKLSGMVTNYYPNGKVTTAIHYKNGIKDGNSKTYADNGILIEDVNYQNGKLNGLAKFFDLKGNLTQKGTFVKGIRTDDFEYYYDGKPSKKKRKQAFKKNQD